MRKLNTCTGKYFPIVAKFPSNQVSAHGIAVSDTHIAVVGHISIDDQLFYNQDLSFIDNGFISMFTTTGEVVGHMQLVDVSKTYLRAITTTNEPGKFYTTGYAERAFTSGKNSAILIKLNEYLTTDFFKAISIDS